MSEAKLFVYGTLKEGGRYAKAYESVLDPLRISNVPGTIRGRLFDLGFFPGVKLGEDGTVQGELHVFSDAEKILPIMNRIEGFVEGRDDNLFDRSEIEVTLENGETRTALVYTFAGKVDDCEEVKSGVWDIGG